MKVSAAISVVVLATALVGCKPTCTNCSTQPDAGSWAAPFCRNCTANRDCADPKNFCVVRTADAPGQCGIDCTADQVCPANSHCTSIIVQGTTVGLNCVGDLELPCGSSYCKSCTANRDCGAKENFCVDLGTAVVCGSDCAAGQACPAGAACVPILVNGVEAGKNCVPGAASECLGADGGSGGDAGGGDGG